MRDKEAFLRIGASDARSIERLRGLLAHSDAAKGTCRNEGERIFRRKISGVRAGGVLVLEQNSHLGRGKLRWERLLFFFGLAAALAILSSCGSSSTAVTPTITISCVPTDVTVLGTSQCTATVLNLSSTLVNWSVSGTGNGTIDSGGLYTAPAVVPTNNVVTITAVSQVQSTLTTTESVTLEQAVAISSVVCDDAQGLPASIVSSGNQLDCTATASTGAVVPVNWSVTNTNNPGATLNLGSISSQGIYSAPLVPPPGQSVTITATSQALATDTNSVAATVVFGNAVLSGPYVFSTSGRLTNSSNAFWARVGTFSAGGGALTGIEDTNQGGSPNTVNNVANNTVPPSPRKFTGSYSIGPDGRGIMQFCEDTGSDCPMGSSATAYFSIVVISPSQAQMIEFSPPSANSAATTAGGEMISQNPLAFPNNGNLSGTYSFNFSGVSTNATEESSVGEFKADGFGNIDAGSAVAPLAPGEIDINPTAASLPTTLAASSYAISSNGRGVVTLDGLTFSFYPVSASRAKFIEVDSPASPITTPDSILFGEAYKQQTSSTCGWGLNALNGLTVLQTSGESSGVVIADLGSFTASNDGTTGTAGAASIDENSAGTVSSALGTLSGNYTMDSCGRGTLGIGTHSYVFYIISPSFGVLQETTSGVIAHGLLNPSQGGPFVNSTLTGSYSFRLGGTDAAAAAGKREDFAGQLTSDGKGNVTAGSLDLNDFGATQSGLAITNGTYVPTPTVSNRATVALPLSTTPASTRNLVLYMVSPTLFYALDTDAAPAGTAIGAIYNQF
jgi:hypothetical protein